MPFTHGRASSSYDHDPAYYGDGCRIPTSPITVSRRRTAAGKHMWGHHLVLTAHSMLPFLSRFPFPHSICQHFPSPLTRIVLMLLHCFLCFSHTPFPAVLLSRDMSGTSRIFTFPSSFPAVRFFPLFPRMLSSASPWQRYGAITGSKGRGGHWPSHVKISTPYG